MANNFDADLVRRWAAMSVELLRLHRAELNALNVFPVPDGDTGTNLFLTFQSAADAELKRIGEPADLADALQALARGALLGARGNSGVMLASVLGAMATTAQSRPRVTLPELMQVGAAAARAAVLKPIEGTALTVLDAAAHVTAVRPDAIAQAARSALAATPDLLPALKAAGVVDAGGRGVVLLLDALSAAWAGKELNSPAVGFVPLQVPQVTECKADATFELMFISNNKFEEELKARLVNAGTSVIVTPGLTDLQAHVHLDEPAEFLKQLPADFDVRDVQIELLTQPPQSCRLVAQVFGAGLVQQLALAGVQVVAGEPNLRPSVQDFVAAGLKAKAESVILLPSDSDSIVVARLAVTELQKLDIQAELVETLSLCETLAAVAVFESSDELSENLVRLSAAAERVTNLAITAAVRDAETEIGFVNSGDYLFLVNAKVHSRSRDLLEGLAAFQPQIQEAELLTLLVGADATESLTEQILQRLHEMNSEADIDIIQSGQNIWHYLIGVE